MIFSQALLLFAIFALCIFLAYEDLRSAFIFLLLVSPLLHKEVFSLVRWDLLPIRAVVLAILVTCFVKVALWLKSKRDYAEVRRYVADPMFVLLGLLWVIRTVSLVNSRNLPASLFILAFFTTMVCLYLVLSYLALRYGAKFILSLVKFYCFVAFGTAVVALLQFVLERYFGIVFGAIWRVPGNLSRVGSVFWDVNHYGGFIAAMIAITLGLFFAAKTTISKVTYGLMSVFMTAILLLTNSRSAWIGFGASLAVLLGNVAFIKFGKRKLFYVALVLAALTIPFVREYRIKDSPFREKIKSYFHYRGDSFASHFMLLQGAFEVFSKNPVIGGGYGSFYEHFKGTTIAPTYYGRDPAALSVRVPAHSIWGEVLSETGLAGTFVFVLLVLTLVGAVFLAASLETGVGSKYVLLGLVSSVVGFLVSGVFYSYNSEFFFLILFLSFIYAKSALGDRCSLENIFSVYLKRNVLPLVLILVFGFLLIFVNLDANHLIPWDEAIYAKVAKNVATTGNYLVLSWERGKEWFEKPPLYMWMSSASMGLFGFASLGAKLPSAFLGLATVILVYLFARRMKNQFAGIISAFVLLTTTQFLYYSRVGMLDISLGFFMLLSMYFYYLASKQRGSRRYWVLSGIAAGLAVMTKGVVGFLTIPMFLAAEALSLLPWKGLPDIKDRLTTFGLFIFSMLAVCLPWHLYVYSLYGKEFIDTYLGYHVIKRATEAIENKGEPFWWYLIVAKTSLRVWFGAAALALVLFSLGIVARFVGIGKSLKTVFATFAERPQALVLLWGGIIFLFFSSAASKLIWYIVPFYPFVAIFVGYSLTALYESIASGGKVFLKYLYTFSIVTMGLMYLFSVRGMVYVPDLTGQEAELIIKKDKVAGTEVPLYYDKVDKPLPMFYSDGPVIAVDYNPLVEQIDNADFDETIVFITKPSRYEKIAALYPNTILLDIRQDWVLGRVKSEQEVLQAQIEEVEERIEWIIKESPNGNPEAIKAVSELPTLREKLTELKFEYQVKSSR